MPSLSVLHWPSDQIDKPLNVHLTYNMAWYDLIHFVASRRRADSHNGSLQDITRNSYPYPGDPDNDVQKHKSDAQ